MQKQNPGRKTRNRCGPKPLPSVDLRTHCVSVRVNGIELAQLDIQRGEIQRGEYLRVAALYELPPVILETNRDAWRDLYRLASNLKALKPHLAPSQTGVLSALLNEIDALRLVLVGGYESQS